MSDHDLRNLYEGVRQGATYTAPKRMVSLYNEVITGAPNANPVEPYTFNDKQTPGEQPEGIVPDEDPTQQTEPQTQNKDLQPVDPKRIKDVVIKWIKSTKFTDAPGKQIYYDVAEMIQYGLNLDLLEDFINKKSSITPLTNAVQQWTTKISPDSTTPPPKHSIRQELLMPMINSVFDPGHPMAQEGARRLFEELSNYTFTEGTVAVGKFELAIALFTEAVKGSVGDLAVVLKTKEEQVEIKVGKARVASARKGGFKLGNLGMEKALVGRMDSEDKFVVAEFSKDGSTFVPTEKKTDPHTVSSVSTEHTRPLTNKEFISKLQTIVPAPYNKAFQASDNFILKMLDQMDADIKDENGKLREPDLQLRDNMISTALIWEYANPGGNTDSGFSKLLFVVSRGEKEKKGRGNARLGASPAQAGVGDFDSCWVVNTAGSDSFQNIFNSIQSGNIVVQRGTSELMTINDRPSIGRGLDGEGAYMQGTGVPGALSNVEGGFRKHSSYGVRFQ